VPHKNCKIPDIYTVLTTLRLPLIIRSLNVLNYWKKKHFHNSFGTPDCFGTRRLWIKQRLSL